MGGEDEYEGVEIGWIRHKGDRFERRDRNDHGGEVDGYLGNVKMTIPQFKDRSDPDAYLDWEKKLELIFDCHNYSEDKKVKVAVLEFTDYTITWWDQVVTSLRRNWESPINT